MLAIPDVVANKARAAGAEAWLADLPQLVEHLLSQWGLVLGSTYSDATEAFVAEVSMVDGTTAVLKAMVPRPGNAAASEAAVLRHADGNGCALLLAQDVEHDALLIERLGPSLFNLKLPVGQRHHIMCQTARQLWRPAAGLDLHTGAAKGRWLVQNIHRLWEQLDHPCSEEAIAQATAAADRRIAAHDDERSVLVHGDVHQWNVLQARDGYKLIDPDGLLAEPEYDLGILMREDPVELLDGDPFDRALKLAHLTDRDATAIWEWGMIERVSTGLFATQIDLQPVGREMLATADAISASHPKDL